MDTEVKSISGDKDKSVEPNDAIGSESQEKNYINGNYENSLPMHHHNMINGDSFQAKATDSNDSTSSSSDTTHSTANYNEIPLEELPSENFISNNTSYIEPYSYQYSKDISKDISRLNKSLHSRVKSSPPQIEGGIGNSEVKSPLVNMENNQNTQNARNIPHAPFIPTELFGEKRDENNKAIIRLENVQKTYLLGVEGVPALRGVSLEIKKGEFVIIYGTSGGGKTSLLNIIGTIDKATKGNIHIGPNQIREQTHDSEMANIRLKKIGFVFQTFNLLGTMTALENVEMPMILLGKLGAIARRKRAKMLLDLVGMKERMHHKPAQLSGGEQQRVTIARAMANNPEIMILDEPTGDLDTKNSRVVMNLLRKLNREHKITMVMVTHDPGLKNAADKVIRIRDGRISGEEVISRRLRGKFWSELKRQMPTEVQDDNYGEVKKHETRRSTEIREPKNYAQFSGCLNVATSIAEKMLEDCIQRRSKEREGNINVHTSTNDNEVTRDNSRTLESEVQISIS